MAHPPLSALPDLLAQIQEEAQPLFGKGKVANYIPALAQVNARQFGMAIACVDGSACAVGDAHTPFSLQSITKLFTFVLALKAQGDDVWQRVGREPSGASPRARRSIPSCSWRPKTASRATPLSTPGRWSLPTF